MVNIFIQNVKNAITCYRKYDCYLLKMEESRVQKRDFDDKHDTILEFEMNENNILFCVYYLLQILNKLSIFEESKLMKDNLLDGKIVNIIQTLYLIVMYRLFWLIESIYINNQKDWLVFLNVKMHGIYYAYVK